MIDSVALDELAEKRIHKGKNPLSYHFSHFGGHGVKGLFYSENSALEFQHDQKNRYGQSCQASSIVWCSYALAKNYEKNPHKDSIATVEKANKGIPTTWMWCQRELYGMRLRERLRILNLSGLNVGKAASRDQKIAEMYGKSGVFLIVIGDEHVIAASTQDKGAIYHYDNEIGCARCSGKDSWAAWAKWCERVWGEGTANWDCMEVKLV